MRSGSWIWAVVVGVACTGQPAVEPDPEPLVRPLSELPPSTEVGVWPRVELIPANGLTLTVRTPEPVSLGGHDFSVYRVDGERAVEVIGALPKWRWNEERTEARLEPQGLDKGAPYLLVGQSLTTDSGRVLATFGHRFRVLPPDTAPPDGSGLRVLGDPQPGSTAALRVPFDEAIQRDAVRKVAVLAGGAPHPGVWSLSEDHRELRFEPAQPWPEGLVVVSVNAGIRDLGGNELADRPKGMLVPMVPVDP